MNTVLVTGATGFIGEHIARTLRDRGVRVLGTVRPGSCVDPDAPFEPVRIEDLSDQAGLRRAVEKVDAVIHSAGRAHVEHDRSVDPLAEFRRVNVEGTRALLEAVVEAGVPRLAFLSTVRVYGARDRDLNARTHPDPDAPYGQSKWEAEQLIMEAARRHELRTAILRPPGVYGPHMKGNILRLFRLVDRGIPVPGASSNRRSFMFVQNLVDATLLALQTAPVGGRAYLVSDGEDVSTAQLARRIGRALDRPARVVPVPGAAVALAGRVGDVIDRLVPFPITSIGAQRLYGSVVVDCSELVRDTGFRPRYTLQQGLQITADWFRTLPK